MHAKDGTERSPLNPPHEQFTVRFRSGIVTAHIGSDIWQATNAIILQAFDLPCEVMPTLLDVARPGASRISLFSGPGAARQQNHPLVRCDGPLRLINRGGMHQWKGIHD